MPVERRALHRRRHADRTRSRRNPRALFSLRASRRPSPPDRRHPARQSQTMCRFEPSSAFCLIHTQQALAATRGPVARGSPCRHRRAKLRARSPASTRAVGDRRPHLRDACNTRNTCNTQFRSRTESANGTGDGAARGHSRLTSVG